jgi:hypothetical protein
VDAVSGVDDWPAEDLVSAGVLRVTADGDAYPVGDRVPEMFYPKPPKGRIVLGPLPCRDCGEIVYGWRSPLGYWTVSVTVDPEVVETWERHVCPVYRIPELGSAAATELARLIRLIATLRSVGETPIGIALPEDPDSPTPRYLLDLPVTTVIGAAGVIVGTRP